MKIFWPQGEEVAADWRKLHTEEHHDYLSPNIRVIKSVRMGWGIWYVACMRGKRNALRILAGKVEGRRLEDKT